MRVALGCCLVLWLIAACGDDGTATSPSSSSAQGGSSSGTNSGTSTGDVGGSGGGAGGPGSGGGGAGGAAPEACGEMVAAANAFLDSLEAGAYDTATAAYGSAEHQNYEFLPPLAGGAMRTGLSMKDMDAEELGNLHSFLQTVYSATGYMKIEAVRALESVLAMQESGMPMTANRDPDNYFIQFFGTPDIDADLPWGFRFTGHHLSLHAAVIACSVYSATPAFWGASPELDVLQPEIDTDAMLWAAFDAGQQAAAQLGPIGESMDAAVRDGKMDPLVAGGVRAGDMSPGQVTLLQQLIGHYLDNMHPSIAADRLAAISDAGLDDVTYARDGNDWRILGPTFIIEWIYASNSSTHVHSVWRDFDGDYGDDLIAQHMASADHQ